MKLLCCACGKEEDIKLLPDNMAQFECGNVIELTTDDLHELFKRYGGER